MNAGGGARKARRVQASRRLWWLSGVLLGVVLMGNGSQSWYSPGLHRIERMTRYEWRIDDRQVIVYPLAVEFDVERSETTLWLFVGGETSPGKTRYFCPRGASLRDGVRPTALMLTRLEATTVTARKNRGDCIPITPSQNENVAPRAQAFYDALGEWRLRGQPARPRDPGQVGLVFLGLPHRAAPYIAVTFPFGEEILFSTRDVQ